MSKVLTQNLLPGMITAEDIYSYTNQLILPKNLVLTDKAITKLELYSVLSIRIKDESEPAEPPEDNTYSAKIKSSPEFIKFSKDFENSVDQVRNSLNDLVMRKNVAINIDNLMTETLTLLKNNPNCIHIFDMLHNMRHYDDPTYSHSLNVAIICYAFGKWLKFPGEELNTLMLCGLLHDIGKLAISNTIISKPAKLTEAEYQIVKTHALEGYNLLKDLSINEHIKNSALMHHERCDGTGYPEGVKADQIDEYAKIVAIADVYDAMTSARIYRGPLCPFQVIEIFENEGLQKYDSKYILTFLEGIVNTYVKNRIRLNNGLEGDVVLINKRHLARPMVQCGGQYIDLALKPNLHIEAII